jgi:hypothetical protein
MRTTGFDKATIDKAINKSLIEKVKAVSCPKCHKSATNVKVANGKLHFETCCEELQKTIMDKIKNGSL